jgi:putative transposase
MPRHPRVYAPGLLYHLMARGNNGQPIFLKPADYESFLKVLHGVRQRYPFYLYAYVLMPNHFHLLLEVGEAPTGRLMQSLLTAYVHEFNRRHRRRGHLFQGRYKAIACERESYLLELVRYIHLNPVRARLVRRPSEWRWSGHSEYLRREERGLIDSGPVMEEFGTPARYEAFVREGTREGYRAEWHPGDMAPFLGPQGFVKRVAKDSQPHSSGKRTPMEALLKRVTAKTGLSVEVLRRRGRSAAVVQVRDGFMWRAVMEEGYRAAEVAAFLGCDPSNVSRALQKVRQIRQV